MLPVAPRSDKTHNQNEQTERTAWRSLLLTIRAKIASIQCGIESFDERFAGQIVLANGQTLVEHARPLIEQSGKPPLLPSP